MPKYHVYRAFKHYVRFWMDGLMFRCHHVLGKENLPEPGKPFMCASNHNNTAIDPLLMVLSQPNVTHPYVLAMGTVFTWNDLINRFWDWLGMLPAFRMDWEGVEEALNRTKWVVDFASNKLIEGHQVFVYPEGNHKEEHWMFPWQVGYLEIAFAAAEKMDFKVDVPVVPTAIHYNSYYGIQQDYLLQYDKPVSLMPYYEQYKESPRRTIRTINNLIRTRVEEMMLFIPNEKYHDTIDFIRQSVIGVEYCESMGGDADNLVDRLKSDRKLVEKLSSIAESDEQQMEEIACMVNSIRMLKVPMMMGMHSCERNVPPLWKSLFKLCGHILLLPLWLVSLVPSVILYAVPPMFMPGKEDPYFRLFTQSMQFILSVLFFIPVFVIAAILGLGLGFGWWWQAVVWVLLWYPMAFFAWYEGQAMGRVLEQINYRLHSSKAAVLERMYGDLRQKLHL